MPSEVIRWMRGGGGWVNAEGRVDECDVEVVDEEFV